MATSPSVSFEWYGEKQVDRTFAFMNGRVSDAQPAFRLMYDFVRGVERRQFLSRGARGGRKWRDTTPETKAAKARRGSRHVNDVLRDTDDLFRSLTRKRDRNATVRITPDSFLFRTNISYAEPHQKGGTPGPPQRRILSLTKADRSELPRILQAWIVNGRLNPGVFR